MLLTTIVSVTNLAMNMSFVNVAKKGLFVPGKKRDSEEGNTNESVPEAVRVMEEIMEKMSIVMSKENDCSSEVGSMPDVNYLNGINNKVQDWMKKCETNYSPAEEFKFKEDEFPILPPPKKIRGWGHFYLKGGAPEKSDEEELKRLQDLYNRSQSPMVRHSYKLKIENLQKKISESQKLEKPKVVLNDDFSNMHHLINFDEVKSISSSVQGAAGTDMSWDPEEENSTASKVIFK